MPFNLGSLPISSGLSLKVQRTEQGYTLTGITKDGKPVADGAQYTVTCLATQKHMIPCWRRALNRRTWAPSGTPGRRR